MKCDVEIMTLLSKALPDVVEKANNSCWDHYSFVTAALSTFHRCLECMPIEMQRKATDLISHVHFPFLGRSSDRLQLMKPFMFEERRRVLLYFQSGLPFIPAIHSRFSSDFELMLLAFEHGEPKRSIETRK